MATPDGTVLLVLRNFHRFMGSSEIVQALETRVVAGRRDRTFVVILSHVVQLPPELERQFVVVDHDLPGKSQIAVIARGVATEPGALPDGDALAAVLDAAAGLTRVEAENAFGLSLVRHGRLAPDVLWELKAQSLKASGLMTLHRGGETFADLGGLDALKGFCTNALRCERIAGSDEVGGPKVFRDSAVANLVDFFDRFKSLNVRSSDDLDDLVARVQRAVRGVGAQDLRDCTGLRDRVATQLGPVRSSLDAMLIERPRRRILRQATTVEGA